MTLDKHMKIEPRKPIDSIIDNRTQKMKDIIKKFLPNTSIAKFAVGYFFISGFNVIREELSKLDKLYILMGNISDSKTLEQIAQGYCKLEQMQNMVRDQKYQNVSQISEKKKVLSDNIEETVSFMDQTDENEGYLSDLVKMIEEQRLHVRVYAKGVLHAKAYLFTLRDQSIFKGYALVGSSNLSLSGIEHNTELNLFVHEKTIFEGLEAWFEELWNESTDFDLDITNVLKKSWALNQITPYDLYIKTVYELVKSRTDVDPNYLIFLDKTFPNLFSYQEVAFRQAIKILNQYNGVFIADVVGLGKTFIGTALLKYYQITERAAAIIICPPSLEKMWNYFISRYIINAKIITTGDLSQTIQDVNGNRVPKMRDLENDPAFINYDIVLIDESHYFRNHNNIRYSVVAPFTQQGRKVILMTATPQNNSPWDLYNQIRLFHPRDETSIPIEGGNLKQYFNALTKIKYELLTDEQKKERSINLQKVLRHILIRRPRSHIEKYYAETDPEGNKYININKGGTLSKAYFPKRKLETWTYSIEKTYSGVYDQIYELIGRKKTECMQGTSNKCLKYAYYNLGNYLLPEKKDKTDEKGNKIYANLGTAGKNLRGLIRTLLFKRFESSVYAFRESIDQMLKFHTIFLEGLLKKEFLVGKESQKFMKRFINEFQDLDLANTEINTELEDSINEFSNKTFDINDFRLEDLKNDIIEDINLLQKIFDIVKDITSDKDAKIQKLKTELSKTEFQDKDRKILIFSQFIDTANYIYEELKKQYSSIYQIDSNIVDKSEIVARFSPNYNEDIVSEMIKKGKQLDPIRILISTDVLSEGLNLQDCYTIINYDLHWNPVRLIQRIGRVDRIGTMASNIYVYNFLPERELERKLGIHEKLHARIQEIQDVIGEDSQILDDTEVINPEAFFAIYGNNDDEKEKLFDTSKDDELLFGLNEAEELIMKLERENKEYMEYIKSLPKGLRSAKLNNNAKHDLFFGYFQAGSYSRFYLCDNTGNLISDDLIKCLDAIKCDSAELPISIPKTHNQVIQSLDRKFQKEIRIIREELKNKLKIHEIQQKISQRLLSDEISDEILRKKIKGLTLLFKTPLSEITLKQLKKIYDLSINVEEMVERLSEVYKNCPEMKRKVPIPEIENPRIISSMYMEAKKD